MKLPVFVLIAMIGLAMGTLGCGEDNVEERVVISEIGQKVPTHTLQEVFEGVMNGVAYAEKTVTIKGTVKSASFCTEDLDMVRLETDNLDFENNTYASFEILADEDKYEEGKTYIFTVDILRTEYIFSKSLKTCSVHSAIRE